MERKTWRRSIDGYDDVGLRDGVSVGDAICDLADFEDTGLEPEEIIALAKGTLKSATVDVGTKLYDLAVSNAFEKRYAITLDRMCELAEADKDGRCVVLPCKVGDTLFAVCETSIMETTVKSIEVYEKIIVIHTRNLNKHGIPNYHDFYDWEFGKTVFLAHEAAEAALEAKK